MKKSIGKLKKEAWKWFSKYIRLRDCLKTTKDHRYGVCVTCGKKYPINKLQAGHFVPGRMNSILFDERNCHAQCVACNCFKGGSQIEYYQFMEKEYGREVIDELLEKKHQTRKFTAEELEEMIQTYKRKVEELSC